MSISPDPPPLGAAHAARIVAKAVAANAATNCLIVLLLYLWGS
jgi:hypothetical protein